MGTLSFKAGKFIFTDSVRETILLDCTDFIHNQTSLSMHRIESENFPILPEVIIQLFQQERAEQGDTSAFVVYLINVLLSARLLQSSGPVNVLEYGSGTGRISRHLAEIMGAFCSSSLLICADDNIEPAWQDSIARVEHPPKLAYYAGDFGKKCLEPQFFHVVLINGGINYAYPDQVISDVLRLVRRDGLLICLTDHASLLESVFKLFFPIRQEYEMPFNKIFTALPQDACNPAVIFAEPNRTSRIQKDLAQAAMLLSQDRDANKREQIFKLISSLDDDLRYAVRHGQTQNKLDIIARRQALLQYAISVEKESV